MNFRSMPHLYKVGLHSIYVPTLFQKTFNLIIEVYNFQLGT